MIEEPEDTQNGWSARKIPENGLKKIRTCLEIEDDKRNMDPPETKGV